MVGSASPEWRGRDPDAPEVERWILAAQRGDAEAFRRLVERYESRAYGLALRIVGSAPEAEEAAQDAFVRVWRALPAFRGEARFSTWLYRIVVRRAYDLAARARARRAREESLDAMPVEPRCETARREDPSEESGAKQLLDRQLTRLTDVQRAAITLYYYEDRSVKEVARVLELPVNTVKTHLRRARAALRAALLHPEGGTK